VVAIVEIFQFVSKLMINIFYLDLKLMAKPIKSHYSMDYKNTHTPPEYSNSNCKVNKKKFYGFHYYKHHGPPGPTCFYCTVFLQGRLKGK